MAVLPGVCRLLKIVYLLSAFGVLFVVAPASAAPITSNSTQPHELIDKLESPAVCAECHTEPYRDWSGSMMGNDFRDPSFLAMLSIAEQDVPGVGDYCLRCHAAGWFEGKSEPPKGDFLGRTFNPPPSIDRESVPLCDLCHRLERVGMRTSRFDGRSIAEGDGSVFLRPDDPWKGGKHPLTPLHKTGEFCGSCHDVSNPVVKNREIKDMAHPLERTYTEWRYSYFGSSGITCQKCHPPMKFPGAQTWLLSPGMEELYPDVDTAWVNSGYALPKDRALAWRQAREQNEEFMKRAADLKVKATKDVALGETAAVEVIVANNTGHRLPTGFAEGRQMWIELTVLDKNGKEVFVDGRLDDDGKLIKSEQTKVYEQQAGVDGVKSFNFAKLNTIIKDNRIPPRGFNKEAYQAEGALIVGGDYRDGQNWDRTEYRFTVPPDAAGPLTVDVVLNYETYSQEFMEWLLDADRTLGANYGGKAAATPDGSKTWAETTYKIWEKEAKGRPVRMAEASIELALNRPLGAGFPYSAIGVGILLTLLGLAAWRWSRQEADPEEIEQLEA